MAQTNNINCMPKVRFPKFVGKWATRKIGDFIEERKEFADKEIPLYSLTIENGVVPKSKRYERSFLVKANDEAYKVMLPGDFAFNPMNLRFGALAMHKSDSKVAVSKYYNIFYCNKECVQEYLEQYLTSYNMIQYYNRMSTGTLEEKKRVHYLDFVHFKKLFPTHPEQQKIASFLSTVDKKIQQLTRKKELLEQYKKGVMQKIFSREIRFQDENGKDYPDWEEKRLGDVSFINPNSPNLPERFVYIDLESVQNGQLLKEKFVYRKDAPSRAQRIMEKGDILFQTVRPYQKNNLFFNFIGEYVASTGYAQIRAKENPLFLYQLLHYQPLVNLVISKSKGSNYPAISATDLKLINIKVPSSFEQKKIASFLSKIDKKIESVQTQLTQTQTFKKGLLQQMFV